MPTAPEISFALKSIADVALDNQVEVNPLTGAASVRVPLPLTSGRSGFSPYLALCYSSSAGNSIFGVGWSLSGLSMIGLSSKRLPKYEGDDQFVFNGSDELVPILTKQGENWEPRVDDPPDFWVHYYRSNVEQDYTRFEKWVHKESGRIHWRVKGPDNSVAVYGQQASGDTRIQDPDHPSRTYQWLIEARYDDNGNAVFYEYLPENTDNIDHSLELQRLISGKGFSQRYIKRIVYGNTRPLCADSPTPDDNRWLFQVVFDYGDHGDDPHPSHESNRAWTARPDPFSTYRPGFEVRTRRLCHRVMMFHHFEQLGQDPAPVGAISFNYRQDPAGTTLAQIGYSGYRTDIESGEITRRATPALFFTYSQPEMGRQFHPIPETASHNLPQGLSGLNYRWMDLYGEGLPGILTETDQAWYYKPNLGRGRFGNQERVAQKPSNLVGSYALSDFDSNGNPDLVVFAGRQAGYCEYDRDADQWQGYRPFASAPVLEDMGISAQWIDLNGDGRSDIIISKQDRFTWYPSQGKEGFGEAVEFANPGSETAAQPQAIEEDLSLKYLFADMTGDGLPDRVHIRNGRVEYWPHLGNGRFGDGIVMENAPVFDFEAQFDISRLRLTDLDGSGTADLLYIDRGEICWWINAGGNRFVEGGIIAGLPYIDNYSSGQVLDFLGDGTPCLVWSSPLNGQAHSPIQYLRLTNGVQHRLLLSVDNTMGKAVELTYSTSARHYLRDQAAGRPWISKLPNHFNVVDCMDVVDRIGNARLSIRYEYHDGFFDSGKRVFRGFGQVDQFDSEVFDEAADIPQEAYTDPACIRTFFHNGAFGWDQRRTRYYYNGDPEQALLTEPVFQEQLDFCGKTFEDGFRALAGQMLRQEIFAVSRQGQRAEHPFQVTQNTYRIRQLQPAQGDDDACFDSYLSEALVYEYEQEWQDPRVTHNLTLAVDGYGNATSRCEIAYPRREAIADALEEQRRKYISATTDEFINIDEPDHLETGIPIESKSYEVVWPQTESESLLAYDTVSAGVTAALADARQMHEPLPAETESHRARLIQWQRLFYWNEAATAALPHGDVGPKSLLHHQESACFNNDLVGTLFEDRVDAPMLEFQGRYRYQDDYWWQPEATLHHLSGEGFFNLDRVVRPDGGSTQYFPDRYHLTLESVTDAVGSRTRAVIDYNLIAPWKIVDPNEKVDEVRYDPLGMIVVTATQGSVLGPSGAPTLYGHDRLADYSPQPAADAEAILADPMRFIQNAGQFLYYDLEAVPLFSLSLVLEQWVHDGTESPPGDSPLQIRLTYTDGFGRALQSKQKVEEGMAIQKDAGGHVMLDPQGRPLEAQTPERWLVSGHTVYNNKQLPVRQYEPFFSPLAPFEDDPELRAFGVSTFSRYDALGRLTRTELPNGTLTKVEITPWEIRSFDPNDTVHESAYGVLRALLPAEDPQRQAYDQTLPHADTPLIVQRDPLGRDIRQIEASHDHPHRITQTRMDIQGNVIEIIDPRGLSAFQYQFDMLGRVLHEHSMDAGDRWMLADAMDQPLHRWDGRGVHQQFSHDVLGRPTDVDVQGLGLDQKLEHMVYGDDPAVANGAQRNACGLLVEHYDQAGLISIRQYAPDGPPLHTERQLVQLGDNYSDEPDWTELSSASLDEPFVTRSTYDALGRVREQFLPDQTTRAFRYLPSGGVNQVLVTTADGELTESPFLINCEYNARGQRTQALLGNDIEVNYTYAPETARIANIEATRSVNGRRTYQNIDYVYDPVGNITRQVDHVQQPGARQPVLEGLGVVPECDYSYDAFYQLSSATGRVHQALLQNDYRTNLDFPKIKGTQHLHLNNAAAVERYTRRYSYDASGNIEHIDHQGKWNTQIRTSATSNRSLPARDLNGIEITDIERFFDANGNCTYMPHLRRLDWNYRNNIATAVIVERPANEGGDDIEYYVYGGDGMRVRKIHRRLVRSTDPDIPVLVETIEKIYLEGCEIKRIHQGDRLILARTTSRITEGADRIALLSQWTMDSYSRETDDVTEKKTRYQLSNRLGSSMLEVSEGGDVITYEEYFPFGGTSFIAGDQREVRLKDYRYSAKECDDATGFYYYGYRYYAAWIGNWLSPDPIGPEDTLNLYQFVRNNPVNFIDTDGQRTRGDLTIRGTSIENLPERYRNFSNLPEDVQRNILSLHGTLAFWPTAEGGEVIPRAEALRREEERLRRGRSINRYEYAPFIEEPAEEETPLYPGEYEFEDENIVVGGVTLVGPDPNEPPAPATAGRPGGDPDLQTPGDSGGADGEPGGASPNQGDPNAAGTADPADGSLDAGSASGTTTGESDGTGTGLAGRGVGSGLTGFGSGGGGTNLRPGIGLRDGRGLGVAGRGAGFGLSESGSGPGNAGNSSGSSPGLPSVVVPATDSNPDSSATPPAAGIPSQRNRAGTPEHLGMPPAEGNQSALPGVNINGNDPNGSPEANRLGARTNADSQPAGRPGGSPGGTNPEGSPTGQPDSRGSGDEGTRGTTLDNVVGWVGLLLNLEIPGQRDGESGGVPGGRGWLDIIDPGQAAQIGYILGSIILAILTGILGAGRAGVNAAKNALKKASKWVRSIPARLRSHIQRKIQNAINRALRRGELPGCYMVPPSSRVQYAKIGPLADDPLQYSSRNLQEIFGVPKNQLPMAPLTKRAAIYYRERAAAGTRLRLAWERAGVEASDGLPEITIKLGIAAAGQLISFVSRNRR